MKQLLLLLLSGVIAYTNIYAKEKTAEFFLKELKAKINSPENFKMLEKQSDVYILINTNKKDSTFQKLKGNPEIIDYVYNLLNKKEIIDSLPYNLKQSIINIRIKKLV